MQKKQNVIQFSDFETVINRSVFTVSFKRRSIYANITVAAALAASTVLEGEKNNCSCFICHRINSIENGWLYACECVRKRYENHIMLTKQLHLGCAHAFLLSIHCYIFFSYTFGVFPLPFPPFWTL